MRLTPAQINVRHICGHPLKFVGDEGKSFTSIIASGRAGLVTSTGQDFGYDLQAWHDHLKVSRDGGYTYGRNIVLPKIMEAALASGEWQAAVAALTAREERRRAEHHT